MNEAIPASIEPDTNPGSFIQILPIKVEPTERSSVFKDALEYNLKKRLEELYPDRRVDAHGHAINHDGWDFSFKIGRVN